MLPEGQLLSDRYRLEQRIGSGGMGAVWRATDLTLGRVVAVKTMRPDLTDDAGFDARFRAEARTLAALNHPNVVHVYDYGRCEVDGRDIAYLVMSCVDGQPLSERLAAAGRLPVSQTMSVVAQAAEALQAVHALGVVHRDVKPANLLVQPDGTVILVDFGVARSPAATSVTTGATVLGSALYMAPEQASGQGVSPATDVYALGVVAYHCLAGRPPFLADTPLQVALRHTTDEPPPLPDDVPPDARRVVARAMAKDPAARYPSAAAFAAAAVAAATVEGTGRPVPAAVTAIDDTIPLAPVSVPPAPVPVQRRRAVLIGAALGIVLLAIVGVAFALRPAPPAGAGEPTQHATVRGGVAPTSMRPAPGVGPVRTNSGGPTRTASPTARTSSLPPTPAGVPSTAGAPRPGGSPAAGGSPGGAAAAASNGPAAAAGPTR